MLRVNLDRTQRTERLMSLVGRWAEVRSHGVTVECLVTRCRAEPGEPRTLEARELDGSRWRLTERAPRYWRPERVES